MFTRVSAKAIRSLFVVTLATFLIGNPAFAADTDCGKCLPKPSGVPVAAVSAHDYLVTQGKTTIWASQATRSPQPVSSSVPAQVDRDYLVQAGKTPVRAPRRPAPPMKEAKIANSPCVQSGFVTIGKATHWESGCSLHGTAAALLCCK